MPGFSLTTKLDITALRTALAETDYKFYPVMIYLISGLISFRSSDGNER